MHNGKYLMNPIHIFIHLIFRPLMSGISNLIVNQPRKKFAKVKFGKNRYNNNDGSTTTKTRKHRKKHFLDKSLDSWMLYASVARRIKSDTCIRNIQITANTHIQIVIWTRNRQQQHHHHHTVTIHYVRPANDTTTWFKLKELHKTATRTREDEKKMLIVFL